MRNLKTLFAFTLAFTIGLGIERAMASGAISTGGAGGIANNFISTGIFGGAAATKTGNFSCPNNPAQSSPCLLNPNQPLEIGGNCQNGSVCNNSSAAVYLGVLNAKTSGPIVGILNSWGNNGGTEIQVWEADWNGDTHQNGDFYTASATPHFFCTGGSCIFRGGTGSSNPSFLFAPGANQTSGDVVDIYGNPLGSPVIGMDFAGKITGQAGTSATLYPMASTAFVDTTARQPATCAGNVDFAGPFSLPANALSGNGKGVRFHFMGTTANNANAKTIRVMWGAQAIASKQLTVSIAGVWEVEGECYRSGSSTQQCFAKIVNNGGTTVSSTDGATVLYQSATLSGTQTDTATISLRVQEVTCTATTDITQTLARVSFDN